MSISRPALAPVLAVATLVSCGGGSQPSAVRLIDLFDASFVQGGVKSGEVESTALWDFAESEDDALGWKAGVGVADLRVVDGKLTGRTTTEFPILYAPLPEGIDRNDGLHSVEVRLRVSAGSNASAAGARPEPNFQEVLGFAAAFPWTISSPVEPGDNFQSLTMIPQNAQRVGTIGSTGAPSALVLLRPTDAAGATFEIESFRVVPQREHRASIPSGVGWQGLNDIYHETIVSRSPESFSIDVEVPDGAWLDLNIGTVEDHPVTFRIQSGEDLLLERTITTPHEWRPVSVDLSSHVGARSLEFSLEVAEQRRIGFWGSPVIRVSGARPKTDGPAAEALGGAEPPQGVLLIMCDTLRKDHLSAYGHSRPTSPRLDAMAEGGALFLDNVSQATWTKVSTPSIMTSLYPLSHRVEDIPDRLSASATTLAEVYRDAGFATVAYSSVLFTGKFSNLHQGFEELHEATSVDDPAYPAKTAREFVDRAVEWIGRHRETPFFMFLHVFDPHDPFEPRSPYDAMWADPAKKEHHEEQLNEIRKHIKDPLLGAFGMPMREEIIAAGVDPDEFVGHDMDWYDGSIRGMDAEMGRLLGYLREVGLEGKVQVAFISDHGEEFTEHGRMFHGQSVYGELTGVPLMLYRPGIIPAGLRIEETVRSIDLMPTLLDLTGLSAPGDVQGRSLLPLIAGDEAWRNEPAVSEKAKVAGGAAPPPRDTASYGIVLDGWKLVHHVERPAGAPEYELFHHAEDPLDANDVAKEHPDRVEELRAELDQWRIMAEEAQLPKGDSTEGLDSQELEKLRSLGYIQ